MQVLAVCLLLMTAFKINKYWKSLCVVHIILTALITAVTNGYLWSTYPSAITHKTRMYLALTLIVLVSIGKIMIIELQKRGDEHGK
jgi:hypothetical protein